MIQLLLFAGLEEKIGHKTLELSFTGKTVAQLKTYIEETYQLDRGSLKTMMVAINEEFATNEETLKSADTVAFIPPVSGG
ncbi:molybdopterin converting factor subunit 1 [Bacillus sp. Marseille-P3800]|uniref:molybdopterin converting factor subunit 1 n=1 Tax=Bacillus sp. Marseille-P3800 TaxID=2014782 RepID=UPI000C076DB6|nr:molybdopterin converting factor subunit 1 [Bacillus sp. Marseille-P3800]